ERLDLEAVSGAVERGCRDVMRAGPAERDDAAHALRSRGAEHELELANFVAAEERRRLVLVLHPQLDAGRRDARDTLDACRKISERQVRKVAAQLGAQIGRVTHSQRMFGNDERIESTKFFASAGIATRPASTTTGLSFAP